MSSKQRSQSGNARVTEVQAPKLDENGKVIPLTEEEKAKLVEQAEQAEQAEPVAPT